MSDIAYIDSVYFLGHISNDHTEKKYAERLKPRLQSLKVIIPQIVLGETLTVMIRDYGEDLNAFKKKMDILAKELTALIDPKECLPVLENKHIVHANHFMNVCGVAPTDAFLLSLAIEDPDSDYLITDDIILSTTRSIYLYENQLRDDGKRKKPLKITDNPGVRNFSSH